MDIILLDWTRMGRYYCLAGAIVQDGPLRIVRPIPVRARNGAVPNQGWSPFLLDRHTRWEVFEMIRPVPASGWPPHREDVWVHSLRPRQQCASLRERKAILEATRALPGKPLFGAPLTFTHGVAYLEPGQGERSLITVIVPAEQVRITASWREGASEPDFRAHLILPDASPVIVPIKDHFLLCRAEEHSRDLNKRIDFLTAAVRQMGPEVAIRLGLSRPFQSCEKQAPRCWLMADGFFSPHDPQP